MAKDKKATTADEKITATNLLTHVDLFGSESVLEQLRKEAAPERKLIYDEGYAAGVAYQRNWSKIAHHFRVAVASILWVTSLGGLFVWMCISMNGCNDADNRASAKVEGYCKAGDTVNCQVEVIRLESQGAVVRPKLLRDIYKASTGKVLP